MVQNNLKLLRDEKRKTIRDVAADTEIGQTAVWKMESGIQEVSSQYLEKFMKYYNCTADYILGFSTLRNGSIDKIIYKERDLNYQSIKEYMFRAPKEELIKIAGLIDGLLQNGSSTSHNADNKIEPTTIFTAPKR